jgi:hypothetical protein
MNTTWSRDVIEFSAPTGDYFLRRDADRHRQRLVSQLQALGYYVTLEPVPAA